MSVSIATVLILLCLFQAKHVIADFFLQTASMLDGRGVYLHSGRLRHAGVHAAASALVFASVGAPAAFIFPVVLAEWAVHYNIDWYKGRYTALRHLTPDDAAYWWATGVDQALHQLTYIAMIWLWASQGLG